MDELLKPPQQQSAEDLFFADQDTLLSLYCAAALLVASLIPRLFARVRSAVFGRAPEQANEESEIESAAHYNHPNAQAGESGDADQYFDTAPAIGQQCDNASTSTRPAPLPYIESPYIDYIKSEERFYQSPELLRHLRHRSTGHMDRVRHKLRLYQKLRKADPSGFQKLLDDPNLSRHETLCLSTWLAVLEYLAPVAITSAVPYIYAAGGLARLAAVAWAVLQLYAAVEGNTSVVGRIWGVYGTQSDPDFRADWWRIVLAHVLEVAYVRATFGMGALVSMGLRGSTKNGQSLGEVVCQVFPVREVRVAVRISKWSSNGARSG